MTKIANLFDTLGQSMMDSHIAVNRQRNPFAVALAKLSKEALLSVICQYSLFPANIVSFLALARNVARKSGWLAVAEELKRNMGEELGTETGGMTHYEMLTTGLGEESALVTKEEVEATIASPATAQFIEAMRKIVGSEETAYSIGGTYALESSAVPELVIVKMLVDRLFVLSKGEPIGKGRLGTFFAMHLGTWEPGHEEGLRHTVAEYITEAESDDFARGFEDVMAAMDAWWTALDAEIVQ